MLAFYFSFISPYSPYFYELIYTKLLENNKERHKSRHYSNICLEFFNFIKNKYRYAYFCLPCPNVQLEECSDWMLALGSDLT